MERRLQQRQRLIEARERGESPKQEVHSIDEASSGPFLDHQGRWLGRIPKASSTWAALECHFERSGYQEVEMQQAYPTDQIYVSHQQTLSLLALFMTKDIPRTASFFVHSEIAVASEIIQCHSATRSLPPVHHRCQLRCSRNQIW